MSPSMTDHIGHNLASRGQQQRRVGAGFLLEKCYWIIYKTNLLNFDTVTLLKLQLNFQDVSYNSMCSISL